MRVFLDANILFSASRPDSLMARFVGLLLEQAHCCTSAYARDEARRNVEIKMPDSAQHLDVLMASLHLIMPATAFTYHGLAEKDQPILGAAVAGGCSHLLTGDRRDFGRFFGKTIAGVLIVSPEQLARILQFPSL